jgi:hypothetical protein
LRALRATSTTGIFSVYLSDVFGQIPLQSPTVFNFFSPDYTAPGDIARYGLRSPEFQITTETTIAEQANVVYSMLFESDYPLNFTLEQSLVADPAALVDHLNVLLMNGAMSAEMRTVVIDTITQIPATDTDERIRSAVYLVLNSPEYVIEK